MWTPIVHDRFPNIGWYVVTCDAGFDRRDGRVFIDGKVYRIVHWEDGRILRAPLDGEKIGLSVTPCLDGWERVRVQGDLWHGKVPAGAVYAGRGAPGLKKSPYCNPFTAKRYGGEALPLYDAFLGLNPELVARAVHELRGRDLACWCKPEMACHVDILIERMREAVAGGALCP